MNGYTFLYKEKGRYIESSISGSLWILPGVSDRCNLISTQHPNFPIDKDRIVFEKVFRTPLFDFNSCATTRELPALNGINNSYYCGSHFGFGVHEDAVTSAIAVAEKLLTYSIIVSTSCCILCGFIVVIRTDPLGVFCMNRR